MVIPSQVEEILDRLEKQGFEAYAVGGCVRDSLLGISPHDWDICTNALPKETKEVFCDMNTVDTGIKHGTVSVVMNHIPYEITTYRCDGSYEDNRRPRKVEFVRDIEEDLKRRDFTVNAMAYSPLRGLVDLFGGREDLSKKLIRCVGDPDARFGEDALRIMRALRFASVYDFTIEKATADAATTNRLLLKNISAERISAELIKLLDGIGCSRIIRDFYNIFTVFLPDFDIDAVTAAEPKPIFRLSAICGDGEVLRRLKFDNRTVRLAEILNKTPLNDNSGDLNRLINKIGYEESLMLARYRKNSSAYEGLRQLEGSVVNLKTLALNGNDLKKMGVVGSKIGEILNILLDGVIDGRLPNEKEALTKFVLTLL